ncbi:MAG TPA: ABC transporter substrate-binding protein [Candidatus Cybelea sp.]
MKRSEALLLAAGALGAAAAPAGAQTPAPVPIRVGAINIESSAEAYYADEAGFFKRAGLDARITAMSSAGAIVSAAMGGSLDVVPTNCVTMAQAYAKGVPLYLVAPGAVYTSSEPTTELAVLPDSPFRSPKDLNGKKVAVLTLGGFLQIAVQNWVDQNGGDSKSISFLELPTPEIVPALQAKRIDAGGLPEPFLTRAKAANEVRFLGAPYSSVGKRLMLSAWVSSKSWVEANPATLQKFITAIRGTADWADKNQKTTAGILSRYTRLPESVILSMRRDPFAARLDPSTIQPIIDVCAKYGLIPRRFSVADLLAPNVT